MRVLTAIILLLLMSDVHAYLDPGTGSMLLQVILGGVAAVGVALKLYWHKLMAAFGVRKKESTEEKVSNSIADAFLNNLSFSVFNDREFVFNSWLKLIDTEEDKLEKIMIKKIKKKDLLDLLEKFHFSDYFITFYADCTPINITKFNSDDLENCFHESYNNINIEMFVNKNLI